jgi:hypothetical protein
MATLADLLSISQRFVPTEGYNLFSLSNGMNDQLSPEDQMRRKQKMLDDRASTYIPTINPGATWGGFDKNAYDPNQFNVDPATLRIRRSIDGI